MHDGVWWKGGREGEREREGATVFDLQARLKDAVQELRVLILRCLAAVGGEGGGAGCVAVVAGWGCGGGGGGGVEERMWWPRGGSVARWEVQHCYAEVVTV